jgi:steroid delta-isomerase-like uncharacterized protein
MYEEAWNEGKLDVVDEICAPDYVGVGTYGDEHGPESVKSGILTRRQAFPDTHVTIEDIIASGDKVVARLTFRGTHTGEFLGVQPTGQEVTWSGIWIYRVANGKFVERWHNYDMHGLMRQLGAIPS